MYNQEKYKMFECLNGQVNNFNIDRWLSVHYNPILSAVVINKGKNYLVDTNETQSDYTSDNS